MTVNASLSSTVFNQNACNSICKSPSASPHTSSVFCQLAKAYPPCSPNTSSLWCILQLSKSSTSQRAAEGPKIPHRPSSLLSEHGDPRGWRAQPVPPGRHKELKGKNRGALSRKHSPIHCTLALMIYTHTRCLLSCACPPLLTGAALSIPWPPIPPHHQAAETGSTQGL